LTPGAANSMTRLFTENPMNDILKRRELEQPRRPSELRRYVSSLFEEIRRKKEAKKQARLRTGLFKYLIREIYPLSVFAGWRYPEDNVLCVPKIGNQGYDAIITNTAGRLLEEIEITWPVDGQLENYRARCLNERGGTEVEVGGPKEGRAGVKSRIIEAARNKAKKDYGNASLVTVLDLWPEFFLDQADDQEDVRDIVEQLRGLKYRARSVYLLLFPVEYIERLGISPLLEVKSSEQTAAGDSQ
jgi:hypothetical protein